MNLVLLINDGHGAFTGNLDWGTREYLSLKDRLDRLGLARQGFTEFTNVTSPAASTIMSIESILSGTYAARTHKLHWREWPQWDQCAPLSITAFLKDAGYDVNGFSYLLNSENWLPSIYCYRPDLYAGYPSKKRDTHSHEAVLAAMQHFFAHAFQPARPNVLVVHSIFLFDLWEQMWALFDANNLRADNTVFALTADHYFPYGFGRQWLLAERDNHAIFHHTDLTEHNTRVFLYVRAPGGIGRRVDDAVSGYDVAPTLVDLMGLRDRWTAPCDGVSLKPLMQGETQAERFLRSDNVYPYQIGEKQGRITAIKKGRFKYVYRPDPVTSYIAYRLTEPWGSVLGTEELYEIVADPFERTDLIASESPEIQALLAAFRRFRVQSDLEIRRGHAESLREPFRVSARQSGISARASGRMMLVQSAPIEVFVTIRDVLQAELPGWRIDSVLKLASRAAWELMGQAGDAVFYPEDGVYQPETLAGMIRQARGGVAYDALINTSGLPVGDYISVYDASAFPVGDFAASTAAFRLVDAPIRGALGLDMTFTPAGLADWKPRRAASPVRGLKRRVASTGSRLLLRWGPRIRRWAGAQAASSRISEDLSARIIRRGGGAE